MLILGAFLVIGGQAVALNGADHRQAINGMAALGGGHNAAVRDQVKEKSRIFAYILSCALFAFLHVWTADRKSVV